MVEGRREARTVEAMRAALVDREAGNLHRFLAGFLLEKKLLSSYTKMTCKLFIIYRELRVLKRRGEGGSYLTPTPPP